jgi:hypothetical protein
MNCLGRGNYVYFVVMVLSLAVLLTYGTYLSYTLLDRVINDTFKIKTATGAILLGHWTHGKSWAQVLDGWAWAMQNETYLSAVGLLATFTSPLAWGLFLYHVYLIWAGTTTNESFKWDEWKSDVIDGLVHKLDPAKQAIFMERNPAYEPETSWPARSNQSLRNRAVKLSFEQFPNADTTQEGWTRVYHLSELIDIYDLGFVGNLRDIFHTS